MMDRKYIDNEHVVDRYMSGDLTVREARDFEKYCLGHPDFLNTLPIPVRLKARLARQPTDASETGTFQAIPSSATRAMADLAVEGFDPSDMGEEEEHRGYGGRRAGNRWIVFVLLFALIAAIGGLVAYGVHASRLQEQLRAMQREAQSTQMQAPGGVQNYKLKLQRSRPEQATLALGWLTPPQLLDIRIDMTEGRYSVFQVTIDKIDGGRVMQMRRIARDSNKELRFSLNSSAFGPGEYLLKFDGYNWRGQTEEVGWVRLGLE